jgi:hypothetical protein
MKRLGCKGVLMAALFLWGCSVREGALPTGMAWHEVYEPMENRALWAFMEAARRESESRLGGAAVRLERVDLRYSRKRAEWRHLGVAEDFSLMEMVSGAEHGVIYLGVNGEDDRVWFLLAHEVVHLLNPALRDWMMEGVASWFAVAFCEEQGVAVAGWRDRLERGKDGYAVSYQLVKELAAVDEVAVRGLLAFAVEDEQRQGWERLDVEEWLVSMGAVRRGRLLAVMAPYMESLAAAANDEVAFTVPVALRDGGR